MILSAKIDGFREVGAPPTPPRPNVEMTYTFI